MSNILRRTGHWFNVENSNIRNNFNCNLLNMDNFEYLKFPKTFYKLDEISGRERFAISFWFFLKQEWAELWRYDHRGTSPFTIGSSDPFQVGWWSAYPEDESFQTAIIFQQGEGCSDISNAGSSYFINTSKFIKFVYEKDLTDPSGWWLKLLVQLPVKTAPNPDPTCEVGYANGKADLVSFESSNSSSFFGCWHNLVVLYDFEISNVTEISGVDYFWNQASSTGSGCNAYLDGQKLELSGSVSEWAGPIEFFVPQGNSYLGSGYYFLQGDHAGVLPYKLSLIHDISTGYSNFNKRNNYAFPYVGLLTECAMFNTEDAVKSFFKNDPDCSSVVFSKNHDSIYDLSSLFKPDQEFSWFRMNDGKCFHSFIEDEKDFFNGFYKGNNALYNRPDYMSYHKLKINNYQSIYPFGDFKFQDSKMVGSGSQEEEDVRIFNSNDESKNNNFVEQSFPTDKNVAWIKKSFKSDLKNNYDKRLSGI